MIQKPMLAFSGQPDLEKVTFPKLISPKLDGIRCVKIEGKALTRKLLPIPNDHARTWVEANLPDGFDGELLLEDLTAPYNSVQSAILSKEGEPSFVFAAFDFYSNAPFYKRVRAASEWVQANPSVCLMAVPHVEITSIEEALRMQEEWIEQGFEGAMLRCPEAPYKFGRSTEKQGWLLKLKKFVDEEAEVIGVQQLFKNENELTVDELGNAKRSSAKDGKVPMELMGALRCKTLTDGVEFGLASGFSAALRKQIWNSVSVDDGVPIHDVIGTVVKFKHQAPPKGRKPGQVPRGPAVFLGFRDTTLD